VTARNFNATTTTTSKGNEPMTTPKTPKPNLLDAPVSTPENPTYMLGRPPISARPIDSDAIIVRSDGTKVRRRVFGDVITEDALDGPQSAIKGPSMKYPNGETAPRFTPHVVNGIDVAAEEPQS
jgi:hypothetical protein